MPFHPPSFQPELPQVPDSVSVETFMWDENYGRLPLAYNRHPFTDGLTGRSYSALELKERIDSLSRALSKYLGWKPGEGSEWDKTIAVFSLNTIDYPTLAWAVHRLGGILTCANASYSASELEYQLRDSRATAIFTCLPLLQTTMTATQKAKIPKEKVYILPLAPAMTQGMQNPGHKTLEEFITEGAKLPRLQPSDRSWSAGEGARRCAFLCYSSGTSGLPKGVMISHKNVIANTLQGYTHELGFRKQRRKALGVEVYTEVALGLLPMSHLYGLTSGSHVGAYRGDGVIVLPKYDFKLLLQTVQDYKINLLYLVPPMIIHLTKSREVIKQ